MMKVLRKLGVSSGMMYAAAFGSIALSIASWMASKNAESAGIDRADRWGIFVGQWAPTFFALGAGLRMEEQWGDTDRGESGHRESRPHRQQTAPEPMPMG